MTKRWTKEPGRFVIGPDNGGTWNQAGLEAGFASASVYNQDHPVARVLVNATAAMSPAQARQLAQVLMDAADKAEERTK